MFGFGAQEKPRPVQPEQSAAAPPTLPPQRTLESVVEEEMPIQQHSVAMEGGMPSCLTLFDNFLLCYSLASQIKSVYRHGGPRECTPKFEDFKFCMSIKSLDEDKKEEVWVRRRAEWWARRRLGKSSEDVWEARRDVYSNPLEEKRKAATTAAPVPSS